MGGRPDRGSRRTRAPGALGRALPSLPLLVGFLSAAHLLCPAPAQQALWGQAARPDLGGADLEVTTVDLGYEVSGATAAEILAGMRAGSRIVDGDTAFAWTETRTDYTTVTVRRDGVCRVEDLSVRLRLEVTLPEWTDAPAASHDLRQRWNRYIRALRIHEDGHVRRARQGGRMLMEALAGLEAPDCERLNDLVRREAERMMGRIRDLQRDYDRDTGHGRTQGASWRLR